MYRSPLDWKNGGSVDLTLSIGELRPRGENLFDEDEIILIVPGTYELPVRGTWQITASGHDDIYEGELDVQLNESVDVTKGMQKLLGLTEVVG